MPAGPLAPKAYALSTDLFGAGGYLRDPSGTSNAAIATTLLNAASRFIDEKCGRHFYDEGTYTRYFDGYASREITLGKDFYPDATTGVILRMAYFENQPLSQWFTVTGDGLTPGASNFFLWPANPKEYVATGTVQVAPYQGFNMAVIPVSNTTFLPTPRPGNLTISLNCGWGWKATPDVIKDMTLKLAARAFTARQAGFSVNAAESSFGTIAMAKHFDAKDEMLLKSSGLVRWTI